MEPQKSLKTYICVDYPGLVKNELEAIRTLGGIDRINQAFSRRNSKLLLNFTPDNIFSKTLCSNQITDLSLNQSSNDYSNDTLNQTDLDQTKQNESSSFANETQNLSSFSNKQNPLSSMPCLLMSVKISSSNTNSKPECKIIGKIKRFYNFHKMADFQYLPMSSISAKIQQNQQQQQDSFNDNKNLTNQFTYTAFYDTFLFNNIQNYDYDLRKNNLPQLFILPPFFSRFDDPVNYSYRSEPNKKQISDLKEINETINKQDLENESNETNDSKISEKSPIKSGSKENNKEDSNELIRSMRQERSSQALLVTFNSKEIPTKPNEKLKPPRTEMIRDCVSKLNELFNKRPCYLKSVLLCITNFSASILKESLPYVAYYFTTGPWRSCWIKFGYDPREHKEAKIYQMIDYRLRNTAEPEHIVKSKPRSSYHKRKFRTDLNEHDFDEYKTFKMEEEMYKFKPDKLPGSRNVFYQICDIEDEDVQKLIHSEENQMNKCNEKDGWCMPNIQDKCRNIMSQKHEKLSKILSTENKEGKKIKN